MDCVWADVMPKSPRNRIWRALFASGVVVALLIPNAAVAVPDQEPLPTPGVSNGQDADDTLSDPTSDVDDKIGDVPSTPEPSPPQASSGDDGSNEGGAAIIVEEDSVMTSELLSPLAYPSKPEAAVPPSFGSFNDRATLNARTLLAGKGIYLCNEVVGIAGPSCGGGYPRADEEILTIARDVFDADQIWVRCGDSRRGFPQSHRDALDRFRPVAHSFGMIVVCWDVPNFWDVRADAERLAQMARHSDAVASDLESGSDSIPANGYSQGGGYAGPELLTSKGERWARAYGGWVRSYLGDDSYPTIAITMQPQTHTTFPFAELAQTFNVFSPMLYRGVTWFNDSNPGAGESVRAGNPFVQSAFEVMRADGVTTDRHDVIVTGMGYSTTGLTAHENQISFDISETVRMGGIGFAPFVFQPMLDHASWAAALAGSALARPPGDVPVPGRYLPQVKSAASWRSSDGVWYFSYGRPVQWGAPGDVPLDVDFDGDGTADIVVWRPSTGMWHFRDSNVHSDVQWGTPGDVPVVGDFDGDGTVDVVVWRPSTGVWHFNDPAVGSDVQWGTWGDVPVPGDFDGDGTVDVVVWRPSTGVWHFNDPALGDPVQWGAAGDTPIAVDPEGDGTFVPAVWRSSDSTWYVLGDPPSTALRWGAPGDIPIARSYVLAVPKTPQRAVFRPVDGAWFVEGRPPSNLGLLGDTPVPADYDGDGQDSMAVWRPTDGTWHIDAGPPIQWGAQGDIPITADFSGDGAVDIVIWRPDKGDWHFKDPALGGPFQWGAPGDVPVAADFDGDGKADIAVWRPATGVWHFRDPAVGSPIRWGAVGDIPVPADYNGDDEADVAVWRPGTGVWHFNDGSVRADVQWGAQGDVPIPDDWSGSGRSVPAVWRPSDATWYTAFSPPWIAFGSP